jgi:NodT family efflux transporter outer membrane factor (OMF) lipoprotein
MTPKVTIAALLVLAAGGCTVGPNYAAPKAPVQEAWSEPLEAGLSAGAPDLHEWWSGFNDQTLDSLVDQALTGSLDLRDAAARVQEARAVRGVTAADQFPTVDATGSATYEHFSKNSFGGNSGFPGQTSHLYDAGFDATWELDLFGRVRRSVEAADADVDAAVESQRDARVVLVAEVARNYVEYRSAQARLAIANQNVRAQQDTLEVSSDRFRAGLASELQVSQAKAQLESTRSQIPQLITNMKRSAFRLDILLGTLPGTHAPDLEATAPVPSTPGAVPIGLPAELLRRRPDIRHAERALASATARIGVAKADLYPRFTLSGSFGLESEHLSDLFESGSHTWSAGPLAVRWPIFDAGRIRSAIHVQEARQEQALVAYERTVLQAYEEVANALVDYARIRDRRDSLALAVQADQQAVDLASDLWTRGLTDFLNVLDTQRALYVLQDQLAESDAAVTTSLVALYKALGGGWEEVASVSAR